MGIPDVTQKLHPKTVQMISETLENIGVIIKIPNIIPRQNRLDQEVLDSEDLRTYIVNPAILYQLVKAVFGDINEEKILFGRLMEAAVIVELDVIKRPWDKIYFYNHDNREVGVVIAPISGESPISLIEIKHRYTISSSDIQNQPWSIFSDDVEQVISKRFPDNHIENRYLVYKGPRKIEINSKNNRTYLFIGMDDCLQHYWNFERNMDLIRSEVDENKYLEIKDTDINLSTN